MNERKLTKSELTKREDIIMNMKGNKRDLVKKYGADAEKVLILRSYLTTCLRAFYLDFAEFDRQI